MQHRGGKKPGGTRGETHDHTHVGEEPSHACPERNTSRAGPYAWRVIHIKYHYEHKRFEYFFE